MPDLSIEKILLFAVIVAPGVVALQVWSLWCPGQKREWGGSLMEIITGSLVNLAIWSWWVIPLVLQPYGELNKAELVLALFLVCLVSPALLASIWYKLRATVFHRKLGLDHPIPRAWDWFLSKHGEFYVLFHMKDGRKNGGYYGENSYAATYPYDPEIYVEELYRVNDQGEFIEKVEGSIGAVIRLSDCERVEFLEVSKAKKEAQDGNGLAATRDGARPGGTAGPVASGGAAGATANGTAEAAS